MKCSILIISLGGNTVSLQQGMRLVCRAEVLFQIPGHAFN